MRKLLFLLLLSFVGGVHAASFDCALTPPDRSQQDRLVWQYTDLLSKSEQQQLNAKLVAFARETSNQILVIVLDTLCGLPESDLAFDIGEKWGIGKKGFDNGIVLLIKPNGPPGQRKVYIATGYGLEGVIPDLLAKRIVDNEVIPNFKAGRYFDGVNAATDVLMALAKGEFTEKSYGEQNQKSVPWPFLVFIIVIISAFVYAWRTRVHSYAKTNNVDFWTAMFLLSQMDRRHAGRYRGGSSGGSFGGGGGFGGFGGGGFGGGGAGGSW